MTQITRSLVLFGGGPRPSEAMQAFTSLALRGSDARILLVAWASGEPGAAILSLKAQISTLVSCEVLECPTPPRTPVERDLFLAKLSGASGVFFSGGDQNRIAKVLNKHPLIHEALIDSYRKGIVFGGTSAGTAIMSRTMISGNGPKLGAGLGLLPEVILDQHFMKRKREHRLFSALSSNRSHLGVGIDEGAAAVFSNEERLEVVGPGQVMVISPNATASTFQVSFLGQNEPFDLKLRSCMSPCDTLPGSGD